MFFSCVGPRSAAFEIEPRLHVPVGVLRKADRARLRNSLKPRRDIDAVAHEVAVGFLNNVAQVDADAEFDPPLGWHAGVALDEAVLHLDRAADRVHDAAELDDGAVTGTLDYAAAMGGDGRVDQIAAETPKARKRPVLVRAGEPAVADDICD
jgi:hypothetical protein